MNLFRPLLGLVAVAAVFAMLAGDADARQRGSVGSRGSKTYSAPPPTATAPNTAAPINRSMTQPGAATSTAAARPPVQQPGGMFGGMRGILGGLALGFLGAGLFGMLTGGGFLSGLAGFASILGFLRADRADRGRRVPGLSLVAAPLAAAAVLRGHAAPDDRGAAALGARRISVAPAAAPRLPSRRSRSRARISTRSSVCSAKSRLRMDAKISPRCAHA